MRDYSAGKGPDTGFGKGFKDFVQSPHDLYIISSGDLVLYNLKVLMSLPQLMRRNPNFPPRTEGQMDFVLGSYDPLTELVAVSDVFQQG
jgi:hypothetical protein